MNNTTKVILGVAVGALAGAVTGLLLAPDDGAKTRKKITKETDKLRHSLSDAVNESLEAAKGKYNTLLDDWASSGRKSITKAKNKVKAES